MTRNNLSERLKRRVFALVSAQNETEMFVSAKKLNFFEKIKFSQIARAVANGVPIQYFEKTVPFFNIDIAVTKNVLVPRPETELLAEETAKVLVDLAKNPQTQKINVIDIATGSGCIILSVYNFARQNLDPKQFDKINFFATDLSGKALAVSKKNAQKQKADIKFLKSDLLGHSELPEKFDLVVANLPYLKPDFAAQNKALRYEPAVALDGGKDGLEIIFRLLESLKKRLGPCGTALLEIDPDQAEKIENKYSNQFKITRIKDLNDQVRFIKIV